MLTAGIPPAFIWTKMGAEAAEGLARIILRKEYERRLGGGVFAWGIGNALGAGPSALAAEVRGAPQVLFSPMLSKPKAEDSAPSSVLLWNAYLDGAGAMHPLPPHLLITSRGTAGATAKARHYALLCHSDAPLELAHEPDIQIHAAQLRNFTTGTVLGASQVTAVVRAAENPQPTGKAYPIAFAATLHDAGFVRLAGERALTPEEMGDMSEAAEAGIEAWRAFVVRARKQWPEGRAVLGDPQ